MNTDFRLSVGYFEHPKVQKLERRLGAEGVLSHLRLLRFVSQYKPDGNLSGMDAEEVGMAGGSRAKRRHSLTRSSPCDCWTKEPPAFTFTTGQTTTRMRPMLKREQRRRGRLRMSAGAMLDLSIRNAPSMI